MSARRPHGQRVLQLPDFASQAAFASPTLKGGDALLGPSALARSTDFSSTHPPQLRIRGESSSAH